MHHVAAHANEFQSRRAVHALRFVPIHSSNQNDRHICKGLDVIDDCRLVPQTLLNRERRFIARFRSLTFDRLEQRRFFAADIAAWTDKNFQFKRELRAEHLRPQQTIAPASANLIVQDFLLLFVFVADVEDAVPRSGQQARKNHSFDDEVRQMRHDEAVLEGAGLAFIGVADDKLFGTRRLAHQLPF